MRSDQALAALLARRIEQEAGEGQIVLDDQQDGVGRLDVVAVVIRLVGELGRIRRRLDQQLPPVLRIAQGVAPIGLRGGTLDRKSVV